jgi:hypothetical protein
VQVKSVFLLPGPEGESSPAWLAIRWPMGYGFAEILLCVNARTHIHRAQAAAMGGNAVLHYTVQQCLVNNAASKQAVYSVLIVSGDAVCITRSRDRSSSLAGRLNR